MSDSADTANFETVSDAPSQPVSASAGASWSPQAPASGGGGTAERPELLVAGAFAGGLILATILKRLAR